MSGWPSTASKTYEPRGRTTPGSAVARFNVTKSVCPMLMAAVPVAAVTTDASTRPASSSDLVFIIVLSSLPVSTPAGEERTLFGGAGWHVVQTRARHCGLGNLYDVHVPP